MKSKGVKPRKGFINICKFCGTEFYVNPSRKNRLCCKQEHTILLSKKNAFRFNCIICGKETFCQPIQVILRNRKTCSIKCRGLYQTQLAKKRHLENGITKHQLDRAARYSKEAGDWREAIFKRDNWTCQICKIRNRKGLGKTIRLEADHIKPFAYFPELRYKLSNGRTLCRPCHDKTKMSAKKMKELYTRILIDKDITK